MYAYEYVYRMYFLAPRKKDERNRTAVHGSPSPVRSPDPRMSLPKGKHRNQSSTPEGGLVAAEPGTPVYINVHFSPALFRLAASPRHPGAAGGLSLPEGEPAGALGEGAAAGSRPGPASGRAPHLGGDLARVRRERKRSYLGMGVTHVPLPPPDSLQS